MARSLVAHPTPANRRAPRIGFLAPSGGNAQYPQSHLVEDNLGFAIKVACEYRNFGLPLCDLVNEGCLGLIEAAKRYDPQRGVKFVTYAGAWVRKKILRALLRYTRTIRIPAYHLEQVKRYKRAEAALATQLGRKPRREEISRRLATSGAKVEALLCRRIMEVPLDDDELSATGSSIISKLEDKQADSPEDMLLKDENRLLVDYALAALSERERLVIESRFGLNEKPLVSLAEVGAMLGLSRERVRQIETQAREKMRRVLGRKRLLVSGTRAIMKARDSTARKLERPRPRRGGDGVPG